MPFADGKRKHDGRAWREEVRPPMLARSAVDRLAYLAVLPLRPSLGQLRAELALSSDELLQVCECTGRCGEAHLSGRCLEVNGAQAVHFRGDVRLAVAHLDQDPTNNDPMNLLVLCQACHNRVDAPHRGPNAARTKARRAAAESAQLALPHSDQLCLPIVNTPAYRACVEAARRGPAPLVLPPSRPPEPFLPWTATQLGLYEIAGALGDDTGA